MMVLPAVAVFLIVVFLVLAGGPALREGALRRLPPFFRIAGARKQPPWLSSVPGAVFRGEALLAIGGAAFVILAFSYPSFSGFFIAEDFTYLGLYQSAGGHFWAGISTPISHTFVRPSAAAWFLAFYRILPVDPLAHHIRNYAMTVVAAGLLYALLRRLVASPAGRLAGLVFFAISKVHLTTIGYINCNDSIMGLIQIEATLYLLVCYFQTRRLVWLVLSLVPYTLEVSSRDYGIVLFAPVTAAILIESRRAAASWRYWILRSLPFAAIAAAYLLVRFTVLLAGSTASHLYQMRLDPIQILWRMWVFAGNIVNVSLATVEVSGSGSFATILQQVVPGLARATRALDVAFVVIAALAAAAVCLPALRRDPRCWVPVIWAAAFIGPTFLIANLQMYYILEPVAGIAVLLALVLDSPKRVFATRAVLAVLAVAAINSAVESRFVNIYSWRFCANAAQRVYERAIAPYQGKPLRSWTLLAPNEAQTAFWAYTLTGDFTCPMLPELLRQPGLRVKIEKLRPVTDSEASAENAPIYMVDPAFGNEALRVAPLSIRGVAPEHGGAVRIKGENLLPTTTVLWNGAPIPTTFESANTLTAIVSAPLVASRAAVRLSDSATGLQSPVYAWGGKAAAAAAVPPR